MDATPIVIRHPDAAAVHVDAWTALAAHAIEPNFFQEPWALLPAWHAFGGDVDLRLVLFYDADGLAGVFPLERVSRWHGLPVPRFRTWRPPHCFLGTPLVRRGAVAACLDALRDWAAKDADGAPLIEIDHYPTAGPFHEEVTAYATSRDCPIIVGDSSERAFLTRAPDPTALVQQFLSADKRKELRRQRRRLAERGVLETRVLRGDQDVEGWLAAFLELEASGWKGREGSAFSMGPSRDYFLEMCRTAHARGRLLFMGLMLDDRPVALKCDILSLPGSCAFRIAYDEAFAKYSPGVLLELDHVHELHARPDWQWMDSGAEPDHPMINHLWRERREIATSTIGAGPLTGDVAVALARAARKGMKLVKRVKQSNQLRLDLDAAAFKASFGRQPFTIGHHLAGHPLFEIPRLIELARALPPALVEYNAGDLAIYQDPSRVPTTGLGIEETLQRIGERNSWMVLKLVDRDPDYRAMLTECLDEIRAHSEALFPGMGQPEAFIFVSSAGAVTPYHMDPEHNFLLQIRGLKTMTVFDSTVVSDVEREAMHAGEHRNMAFHDAYNAHSRTFDLTPGTGLHVPVGFPHHVKVGPDVSVSFSVTFRTPDLDRLTDLHNANRLLRARGLTPSPVGRSAWRDELKYQGFRAWRKLRRK